MNEGDRTPDRPEGATRPRALPRSAFRHFAPITTRWMDNDAYGHLNNVVYYSLFDTAVNRWLIGAGVLDMMQGSTIGFVVETRCHFFAPLSFPQPIEVGLRLGQAGRSSVRYTVGVFAEDGAESAAHGSFVHVYVDRQTRRPVELPEALRHAVERLR